jgi:hypothetical protein
LNGIIAYLTRQSGKNVSEAGVVLITASSAYDNDPRVNAIAPSTAAVADANEKTGFCSANQPGQWLCYDFNRFRVTPTHYSVRAHTDGFALGVNHPRSWVVEGSRDGASWTVLDRCKNDGRLAQWGKLATFAIASPVTVKCLRFRLTGRNHQGTNRLAMSALEVFGSLSGPCS